MGVSRPTRGPGPHYFAEAAMRYRAASNPWCVALFTVLDVCGIDETVTS